MKQYFAFIHKEYLELYRGGKLFILMALAVLQGIMNPALAKLTPLLFEMLGEELAEQGMIIQEVTVTALTSWSQFYKNLSIAIIIPAIFFAGIMASEYQRGTLINLLTKGLERWKVIAAKLSFMIIAWTIYFFIFFILTYSYTGFYWDNSIIYNILPAALGIYLFGIMLMSLVMLGAVITTSATSSLLFSGGVFIIMYIISALPKIGNFMPMELLSMELIAQNGISFDSYGLPLIIAVAIAVLSVVVAVISFNKRRL
ncbi:ABC transporter permease subunit [Alloiococcus sp. CFN-8]|uniref:ABC transporter permease subunit n=1 Tax=Alloiococcus sp. CFN-8 TaxID=3416081 RepID=UPI003CECF672